MKSLSFKFFEKLSDMQAGKEKGALFDLLVKKFKGKRVSIDKERVEITN